MDRNEAKEFHPIMQAFAEGKVIECRLKPDFIKGSGFSDDWTEVKDLWYMKGHEYRIKPEQEPKFRPFASAEECWQEMQKHQPFGYTYDRLNNIRDSITKVATTGVSYDSPTVISFAEIFGRFVFADGVPFGVKVE